MRKDEGIAINLRKKVDGKLCGLQIYHRVLFCKSQVNYLLMAKLEKNGFIPEHERFKES